MGFQTAHEDHLDSNHADHLIYGRIIPFFDLYSSSRPHPYSELGVYNDIVNVSSAYIISYFCAKRPELGKGLMRDCSLLTLPSSKTHTYLVTKLLAGDIETNPGPTKRGRKPKWPCGICQYAVKNGDSTMTCDRCNLWIHNKCSGISDSSYIFYQKLNNFVWICPACEVINFEDSYFSNNEVYIQNAFDVLSLTSDISGDDSHLFKPSLASSPQQATNLTEILETSPCSLKQQYPGTSQVCFPNRQSGSWVKFNNHAR